MSFINKSMSNKVFTFFVMIALMVSIFITPALAATTKSATPTASKVIVNGSIVSFEAYTIDNNNYLKLRDLAKVVSGTGKQFEVAWDGSKNAINLVSGKAYTAAGGELNKGDGLAKSATLSTSKIYKDGNAVNLTAYTINSNNYFKLRDVAQIFDIGVTWDAASSTVGIDTSISYATPSVSTPSTPASNKLTNQQYQEAMGPVVTAYEEMIDATNNLLNAYDGSKEWIDAFAIVYKQSGDCVDFMINTADTVPSDYLESHKNIAFAMAAYTDAFMAMAEMIDAVEAGKANLSEQKMGEYIGLFVAAEVLWDSAVK
jgi:hypothetical protein